MSDKWNTKNLSDRPTRTLKVDRKRMDTEFISHIGIAVKDLQKAIDNYRLLMDDDNPVVTEVIDQKVKIAMFTGLPVGQKKHGVRIELVAATSAESPVAAFITARGEGLHHVCVYVDDIEERLAQLKAANVRLIDETPRMGAEGNRIAFVHPSGMNGVLIELEEKPK